ncbi:hypothetical protein GCM10011366_06690 [Ornithinimicrobium tianjinense]|uniref:HNH nuclease domain-containing protein n=1 Tax=Ornithinimicrobium tianjinense TaxID=1195761 RepID=A0A917BGP0_9MICO|nr:hypothetical protein GCM10011366_06690 [Ornithinimicrobium tianjinense]
MRAGRTGIARAATVARTLTRIAPTLQADQQEAYAAIVTDAACNPALSDRDLSRVCKKLLIDLLDTPPDPDPDPHPEPEPADGRGDGGRGDGDGGGGAAGAGSGGCAGAGAGGGGAGRSRAGLERQLRLVTRQGLGGGMTRYTIDAPEDDAALLDGILAGPLARPVPGPEGTPDLRSAGQRRYDALLTVLGRGLGHPGAPPSTARASVIITVRADPSTGHPTGAATTQTGQVFPARAAGPSACTGDLTPVVLGPHGEPLALGSTQRLATPGQYKALIVRDEHCVFPGCTVPGTWCEAHHATWWSRGGPTDLTNLALLCTRHHQQVHDKDLTVTVNGAHATVHLR